MNNVILGVLEMDSETVEKLKKESKHSLHMEERSSRMKLFLENAEPLYFYEVFRKKDHSRQIHCLYEDSSLIIYNKSNGRVITILLLNNKRVEKYLKVANDSLSNYPITRMCAKIHEKFSNFHSLDESVIEEMRDKKIKYVKRLCKGS